MANAVEAGWNGHDYQARFFWYHASALRDTDQAHVIEVTYEADGPKGFDDVIVRYKPPGRTTSSGPGRISVDFHQVKFHVTQGGRFGYKDLINPAFIGATSVSLLKRLLDAKTNAPCDAAFTLVTTDRVSDGDQLGELISNVDHSLRMDKLFITGGDHSKMGKVRKLWRDHLQLGSDAELKKVLTGFHINQQSRSLEQMRDEVNNRFRVVGLVTCRDTVEFRFDAVAKELKRKKQNRLNREEFEALCLEEGWVQAEGFEPFLNVSMRSFGDVLSDHLDATPDNTLSLVHYFDGRHLRPSCTWTGTVQPAVVTFLADVKAKNRRARLYLDTHASIAFLAGSLFGLKSGMDVELVQKGRSGTSIWRADDNKDGPTIAISTESIGSGRAVAVVVSLSRDGLDDVREFVSAQIPAVGTLLHATPSTGIGQMVVGGGAHAARLADDVAAAVRKVKPPIGMDVHIFVAGPNAFTFFLGQHRDAMGPCVVYEFDFSRTLDGSYQPAFRIA